MKKSQIKVLERIYSATDCSNGVFEFATLHWSQERIAEQMPAFVVWAMCVQVDGDGFTLQPERWRKGYRLTTRGYEELTKHNAKKYPRRAVPPSDEPARFPYTA